MLKPKHKSSHNFTSQCVNHDIINNKLHRILGQHILTHGVFESLGLRVHVLFKHEFVSMHLFQSVIPHAIGSNQCS